MELKEVIDKNWPQCKAHFIGKKCLKFIESEIQIKNAVSIVPIIG